MNNDYNFYKLYSKMSRIKKKTNTANFPELGAQRRLKKRLMKKCMNREALPGIGY